MTRTGTGYRGGNIARARFCNGRHAALMLRIHADGSTNTGAHGIHPLSAFHRGWTDDIYARSRRAAAVVQHRSSAQPVRATSAPSHAAT